MAPEEKLTPAEFEIPLKIWNAVRSDRDVRRSTTLRFIVTAIALVVLMTAMLTVAAAVVQIRTAADEVELTSPELEDHELQITLVNTHNQPVVGASVRTSVNGHELELLTTDDLGRVTSMKRGTENVFVSAEATGYRRAGIVVEGTPETLQIILTPQTELVIVDKNGTPLDDMYVVAERFADMQLGFDQYGIYDLPYPNTFKKDHSLNRSNANGQFRLVSDLTLRSVEKPVPLWAVSDNGDQLGWIWVLPENLDQPQTLVLHNTAIVEAALLLKSQPPETSHAWSLLDSTGTRIAGLESSLTPLRKNTLCRLRFRLPPGAYSLQRASSNDPSITMIYEFKVEPDQSRVELGMVSELSDAINSNDEWGSVCGQIQVTNITRETIRPRILIGGAVLPQLPVNIVAEDFLVDPVSGGLAGAFVYVAKAPATIHPDLAVIPATRLLFDHLGRKMTPHTMIVRTGQTVEMINSDPTAGNIHIFPLRSLPFNYVLKPATKSGSGITWVPKVAESQPFAVRDDFYPWMSAYWLVIDHPYAAITDKHGRFLIEDLPPGEHRFKIWHERVGLIERNLKIQIAAGNVTVQPTIAVDAGVLSGN